MKATEWLQSVRRLVMQVLRPRTPATDEAVSVALQSAGLLSVLLFLVRNVFELFVAHGLYQAQHPLIVAFDGVLAVWALVEVVRISRTAAPIRLGPLVSALVAQVAVGAVRALLLLATPAADEPFERLSKPFEFGLAALFVPVHAVVFLVIGKLIINAFSDAERANAAKQRRILKLKLESSLMASAVAHEIKLPLSSILLRTRLARDAGGSDPEMLEAVACDAQEVVRTIEKMKILLRSVQSEHTRIDLTGVVRTCLVESKWQHERLGIVVTTSGLDKPCVIDGDEGQLRIAVMNVLRNAAEAIGMVEGGAPSPTITVSLRRRMRSVVLTIGDSGPGWSGVEREDVPLSTTKPSGSGIGLYVVRAVVRNHRGKIAFRTSGLGGAELQIRFPLELGQAGPGKPAAVDPQRGTLERRASEQMRRPAPAER